MQCKYNVRSFWLLALALLHNLILYILYFTLHTFAVYLYCLGGLFAPLEVTRALEVALDEQLVAVVQPCPHRVMSG